MMLDLARPTSEDIAYIAANAWQRGLDEARVFGVRDRAELRDRLERYGQTEYSFCVKDDGRPVAFFGALEAGEDEYHTWLQATEDFTAHGRALTLLLRNFIAGKMAEHPTVRLNLYSASAHPKADRWFRLIGFEPVGEAGEVRAYRWVPR